MASDAGFLPEHERAFSPCGGSQPQTSGTKQACLYVPGSRHRTARLVDNTSLGRYRKEYLFLSWQRPISGSNQGMIMRALYAFDGA